MLRSYSIGPDVNVCPAESHIQVRKYLYQGTLGEMDPSVSNLCNRKNIICFQEVCRLIADNTPKWLLDECYVGHRSIVLSI